MCGGGGCNSLGLCMGEMTYTIERLAACIAMTAMISCMIFTLLWMLGAGVGLGYNYCYVEAKLNETLKAAKAYKKKNASPSENATTTPGPVGRKRRSLDLIPINLLRAYLQKSNHSLRKREEAELISNQDESLDKLPSFTESTIRVRPTMVVPLRHFGLIILIEKLQKKTGNFTLELITANS